MTQCDSNLFDAHTLKDLQNVCDQHNELYVYHKLKKYNKELAEKISTLDSIDVVLNFIDSIESKSLVDFNALCKSYLSLCKNDDVSIQFLKYLTNFKYLSDKEGFFESCLRNAVVSGKLNVIECIKSLNIFELKKTLEICAQELVSFYERYDAKLNCREYPLEEELKVLDIKDALLKMLVEGNHKFSVKDLKILKNWFDERDLIVYGF